MKSSKEERDLNAIAARAGNGIKEMAEILAAFPAPEKWTQKQKAQAVQFAALLDAAQNVIRAKAMAGIDWQKEKEIFLSNAGRTRSCWEIRKYPRKTGCAGH
jgi:translation elongation factor EF-4